MRAPRRLAAAASLVAVICCLSSAVPPANAAQECLVGLEVRNEWSAVPSPPHAPLPVVTAESSEEPCTVYALAGHRRLYRSEDGGRKWIETYRADHDLITVTSADLFDSTVALLGGTGMLVSHDRGQTFVVAAGLEDLRVLSTTADPAAPWNVYVAVRGAPATLPAATQTQLPAPTPLPTPAAPATPGPTIWVSRNGGTSFSSLSGSNTISSTRVGVDPRDSTVLWSDDTNTASLWRSSDSGQSFTEQSTAQVGQKASIDVPLDLDLARLAGGGTLLLSAVNDGILRSADGGGSFSTVAQGKPVTSLAIEHDHPTVYMAVVGGELQRAVADETFVPAGDGLPSGCAPGAISGDDKVPSVFLVRCDSDGKTYRYRSDGSDLSAVDSPNGAGFGFGGANIKTTAMRVLGRVNLPNDRDLMSGSIAFDGTIIYYTDHKGGFVHRTVARTNAKLPDLILPLKAPIFGLTYDSLRHALYTLDARHVISQLDLRTNRMKALFTDPVAPYQWPSYSYDPSIDRFRATEDGGSTVYEIDRDGTIQSRCSPPPSLLPTSGNVGGPGMAAVVSSGDGGVYAELEDDSSVLRLTRRCEVVAAFRHDQFSESGDENDQMACDTVTFGEPAIWIRDASKKTATAFATPDGYCARATRLAVTTNPTLPITGSAPLCARLWLAGEGAAIAGQQIHFYANSHDVGSGKTDGDGIACAVYRPSIYLTPGDPLPGSNTPGKTVTDHQSVLANYFGTIAYRPGTANGFADVLSNVPPPPPPVQPQPILIAPPPIVAAGPPPQPPNAPQPQPIPQSHPGIQPGAVGQPGAAAAPEQEVEAADQAADVHEYRALDASTTPRNPLLVPEIIGFALAAVELERRRRRSHVRAQRG